MLTGLSGVYLGHLGLYVIFSLTGKEEGRTPAKAAIRLGTKWMTIAFPVILLTLTIVIRLIREFYS